MGLYNLKSGVADSSDLPAKVVEYAAAGAVTIESHVALITKADGAAALTLAVPSTAENGTVITFIAGTAQAHTVTATTVGFNLTNAGGDVGTFGGAVGDGFSVIAAGGEWYVMPGTNLNVTLG